jgi:hypothetical protein
MGCYLVPVAVDLARDQHREPQPVSWRRADDHLAPTTAPSGADAGPGGAGRLPPRQWVPGEPVQQPLNTVSPWCSALIACGVLFRAARLRVRQPEWEIIQAQPDELHGRAVPPRPVVPPWIASSSPRSPPGLGVGAVGPAQQPGAGRRAEVLASAAPPWPLVLLVGFGGVGWGNWGGLLLTLFLATAGIVLSFPIGLLLALGRRSTFPVVRIFSVLYIELIRGVPLITLLFMGNLHARLLPAVRGCHSRTA